MVNRRSAYAATEAIIPNVAVFQEVNSVYGSVAAAVRQKDVKAVMDFVAEDGMAIGLDGTVHKRHEWEQDMIKDAAAVKSFENVHYQIDKLTVTGGEATAYTTELFSGTLAAGGQKFSSKIGCRDMLIKTPKGWRLKLSETIKSSQQIDGQAFSSKAHTRHGKSA